MRCCLLLFCGVSMVSAVKNPGKVFTFRPNTNFDTGGSWDTSDIDEKSQKQLLPCTKDTLLFEQHRPIATFIGSNITFSNLILPENGEILFGSEADYVFATGNEGFPLTQRDCEDGKERRFIASDVWENWHDGSNWVSRFDSFLHIDRVPSDTDKAIFMDIASYRVLIEVGFNLSWLEISGMPHNTNSFYPIYLMQSEGRLQFRLDQSLDILTEFDEYNDMNPPIKITNTGCKDLAGGCWNSNLEPKIFAKICEFPQCESKGDLPCTNPIQPVGHCCLVCAGRIYFKAQGRPLDSRQFDVKFTRIREKFIKALSISFNRISNSEEAYQIAVAMNEKHKETFDPELISECLDNFQSYLFSSRIVTRTFEREISTIRKALNLGESLILSFCIILLLVAVSIYVAVSLRRGSWRCVSRPQHIDSVMWRRSQDDEIAMEMVEEQSSSMGFGFGRRFLSGRRLSFFGLPNPSYRKLLKTEQELPEESKGKEQMHFANPVFEETTN